MFLFGEYISTFRTIYYYDLKGKKKVSKIILQILSGSILVYVFIFLFTFFVCWLWDKIVKLS